MYGPKEKGEFNGIHGQTMMTTLYIPQIIVTVACMHNSIIHIPSKLTEIRYGELDKETIDACVHVIRSG